MTGTELPSWVKVGAVCPLVNRTTPWGTATIEKINKRFIVAGGDNYSIPSSPNEDRLFRTGERRWQAASLHDPDSPFMVELAAVEEEWRIASGIRGACDVIDRAARNGTVNVAAIRPRLDEIRRLIDEVQIHEW